MGLFSWLFGKKKKETDKIEEIKTKKSIETTSIDEKKHKKEAAVSPSDRSEKSVSSKKTTSEISVSDKSETVFSNSATEKSEETVKKAEGNVIDTTDIDKTDEDEKNDAITGKFEINRSKDGKKYFFNLYASNKIGIATSQMYSSAQSALIGVKSVISNAANAPVEDQTLKTFETLPFPKWIIYIDKGGKYRFHLSAANGSNVCHSQGYTTKSACKNGIDSVIRSSRNAVIDKTYLTK